MEIKTYSRKQAGVIYAAMKRGDIEVPESVISKMYDMVGSVEVYNTNSSSSVESFVYAVKNAIDAIFENDYKTAQVSINNIFGTENKVEDIEDVKNQNNLDLEFENVIVKVNGYPVDDDDEFDTIDARSIIKMIEELDERGARVYDRVTNSIKAMFTLGEGEPEILTYA